MNPRVTRRSVLMTGAAAFALGGTVTETTAQQAKKGGTLQFAISAETPHYDNHGSDTYATLHFAAPFYSTLLRFNLAGVLTILRRDCALAGRLGAIQLTRQAAQFGVELAIPSWARRHRTLARKQIEQHRLGRNRKAEHRHVDRHRRH